MSDPRRWVTFLWMNLLALVLAVAVFLFVGWADFLDGGVRPIAGWLGRHPGWASVAAAAPLLVTILIGAHYMRRGMRKRREKITSDS